MAEHIKLTYQEAIEILESNRPTSGYTMLNTAIDMAKEMLSKQTPKNRTMRETGTPMGTWYMMYGYVRPAGRSTKWTMMITSTARSADRL